MGKKKNSIYVVYKGRIPGVYLTWDECQEQTNGFSGPEYKGYKNVAAADADCQKRTGKSLEEIFNYDTEQELDEEDDIQKQIMREKICKLQEKIRQNMQDTTISESVEYFCREYGYRDSSIARLSEDQKRAVGRIDGNSLLFAVPGSGKTAVIVARTGYLIHGSHGKRIAPDSIMTLTFSRKAALEMHARYYKIFPEDTDGPNFKTIHSFCLGHILSRLKSVGYEMPKTLLGSEYIDPETGKKRKLTLSMVVKGALKKIKESPNVDDETCQNISTAVTYIKNNMLEPKVYEGKILYLTGLKLDVAKFYDAYEEVLHEEYNAYDFDDMLLYAYEGLREYPDILENLRQKYKYWSIDEAQDNSLLQYKLLNLLTAAPNSLFMVGDDDQSIYSFRGAKPQLLLDYGLAEDTVTITMGVNYRSDNIVVRTAKNFIEENEIRADKDMVSFSKALGEIRFYTMLEDSVSQYREIGKKALQLQENIGFDKCNNDEPPMAILYKRHYSAVPVAFWLYKYGVAFRMSKTMREIMRGRIFSQAIKWLDMLAHPFSYKRFIRALDCIGAHQLFGKPDAKQKKKLKQLVLDNPKVYVYRLCFQIVYDDKLESLKADYEAEMAEVKKRQDDYDVQIKDQEFLNKINQLQDDKITWYEHFEKLTNMSSYDALEYMARKEILLYSDNRQSDRMRIYGLLAAAEAWTRPEDFMRAFREICNITDKNNTLEDGVHDADMTETAESEETEEEATEDKEICERPVLVDMMSMHASKGLQYDKVLLIDCLAKEQKEKAKDAFDTEEPEEPRRLYYVAMTRAKHELSILVVQRYYGNKEDASRFLTEIANIWEDECQEQVVQHHAEDDIGSTSKICLLHKFYAVVRGYKPGIYESWEECKKNIDGFSGQECKSFATLEEAEAYYYGAKNEAPPEKLSAKFLEELILPQPIASFNRSVDLPDTVNKLICSYMHVDCLENIGRLKYENMNYKNVDTGGFKYTDNKATTYLISYLPMHFYKIYLPLSKCLENLPQQNVMLLELGPGPGTSTLAMVMFYASLAQENPQKQFSLEIRLIEKAASFVKILKFMLANIKPQLPPNMMIKGVISPKDIKEGLESLGSGKYDLIYESNVFNKNESADSISYAQMVNRLVDGLKDFGKVIFIEPNYSDLAIWNALQNNDDLEMLVPPARAKVNVQGIALQKVALNAGIRYKNIEDYAFSYAICQKR